MFLLLLCLITFFTMTGAMVEQKKISIVIPCYNEEKNIHLIYDKIKSILQVNELNNNEIIFVNDGSLDNTWGVLSELANKDSAVKCINFTRNFGHQTALTAGYDYATGDAIISMDCDLQDPPEIIIEMLNKWRQGKYIIYARRRNRNDGFLKKVTADIYYRILSCISDVNIPRNVGDFRLIDKRVLEILKQMPERHKYLRGLVAWTGYSFEFVDFDRANRNNGVTGYTWKKMFKLAFDGLTSFSTFPLRLSLFIGLFFIFIPFFFLFYGINYNFSINVMLYLILVCICVQYFLLWILGEYLGRTYEQIKGRPVYVIEQKLNL